MANLRVDKITSTETFDKTGSVQFDGSGDYLSLGTSSTFNYLHDRTEPYWTIEGWIYFKESGSYDALFGNNSGTAQVGVYLGKDTSDRLVFSINKGTTGVTALTLTSTETFSSGKWYHIAVTNNNYLINTFINGVNINSGYWGSASTNDANTTLNIGRLGTSTVWDHNGHISNLRILKGQALYTTNFKPSMRELEVVPGTVLLCCQSKTDASLEKTGKTITVNGNAVANELTPGILTPIVKSGGGSAITGSVEFDGNDDYLQVTANSDLSFTGDFTVEYWVYISKSEADMRQIGSGNYYTSGKNGNWYFGIHNESGGNVYFYTYDGQSNAEFAGAAANTSLNSWYHLAAARVGNTLTIYVNGVKLTSGTISKDLVDGSVGGIQIGKLPSYGYHNGFISNLRIVKGTALYTADFIPPTRELKNVPGTVLLCCQDPDNPLTEATGKTITPYGNLGDGSLGGELVTNNSVWTLTKGGSGATDWTVSNQGRSLAGSTVTSGFIRATYTLNKGDYLVSLRWTGGTFAVQDSTGYITTTSGIDTDFAADEDGAYSFYMSNTTSVIITGTAWNTAYTVNDISIKRIYKNNGASNFTPQVGDDRQATFEGVTKIDTDAYFYLPTGDTASREATGTYNAGTRGLYSSFESPVLNTIEYLTIASLGSVENFGDLSNAKINQVACSSDTRGLFASGYTPSPASGNNFIDFVTIMSTGNALDFGDLSFVTYVPNACSNQTRGIFAGGAAAPAYGGQTNMDYVTIASKGNGRDFGDLTQQRHSLSGVSSPTRGVFAAGNASPSSNLNNIDYITIASTGNAKDFGDLTLGRAGCAGASSAIRGLFAGGYTATPSVRNIIDFITIATTGNAQDFGDLTAVRRFPGGTSSSTRAVFMAGYNPSATNTIDFVSIQTTGNATDFGDTTINKAQADACSNGHGGLG